MAFNIRQWFGKLKIGQKINFGYAIVLGVGIVGTNIGIVTTQYYQNKDTQLEENILKEIQLLNRLHTNLLYINTHKNRLFVSVDGKKENQQEYAIFLDKYIIFTQSWQKLKEYQRLIKDKENLSGEAKEITKFIQKYGKITDTFIKSADTVLKNNNISNLTPESINIIQSKLVEFDSTPLFLKIDDFSEDFLEVMELKDKEFNYIQSTLYANRRLNLEAIAVTILLSGGIAVILAININRAITIPIRNLIKVYKNAIYKSNFDVQNNIKSVDEIGVLADTFNQLIITIQNLLNKQKEAKKELESINTILEKRVIERTEELNEKNLYLKEILEKLNHTQAQMIQNEKMSALGQMVAGIAHEINNPVNFIYANLPHMEEYIQDLIKVIKSYQEHLPNPPQNLQKILDAVEIEYVLEDLDEIIKSMTIGTERIQKIVVGLRNFSRLDEAELKQSDLHEGIDSTLMILNHRFKVQNQHPEIQVIKEYGQLPIVECYPGHLNQVFMNLLSNAIDALDESIISGHFKNEIPKIIITTQVSSDNYVLISIADNGIGISPEIKNSLFNPFFTTKPVGKGTGLGLSISYEIVVEKHGGKIWYESSPGQGTKFMIEIPIRHQTSQLRENRGIR